MTLYTHNSSFSRSLPGLQLGIDSTSLGEFKQCPRKYYYSIVLGYQPRSESVHLTFGLLLHKARETYDRERLKGADHDGALDTVLDGALRATWNSELRRPWISDHKLKNRLTLIRSIVWYLDQFAEDPIETWVKADGQAAVELSFQFDSSYRSKTTGEPFLLCGHMDRIGRLNSENWIVDIKTTTHSLGPDWFGKFTPDNQMSLYSLAGRIVFGTEVKGVIVDGLQIGAGFTRMHRAPVPRDKAQLDDWFRDLGWWLAMMETCAVSSLNARDTANAWPQNDKACDMYGGCQFRAVCSRTPAARQGWLETDYKRRVWDPLIARGDF